MKILLFDDYPTASENTLLLERIRRSLASVEEQVEIFTSCTVADCEAKLGRIQFDCVILDIMAESSRPLLWHGSETAVPSSFMGVGLLRRCRAGVYKSTPVDTPIYMRSARGEEHTKELCSREGATDYFLAGTDDSRLVMTLLSLVAGQHESEPHTSHHA